MARLPGSSAGVLPSGDDIELDAAAFAPAVFGEICRLTGETGTVYHDLPALGTLSVGSTVNMDIPHVHILQSLLG